VTHVAQQRTRVGTRRVLERGGRLVGVVDQQVRDHGVAAARAVAEGEVDDSGGQNPQQDVADGDQRVAQHDRDDDPHEERPHLVPLAGLLLVGLDDLFTLARRHRPHFRSVAVVGVVVHEHVLQLLRGEQLRHRLRQHRLPRPRRADHHDVSPLLGRLHHHVTGVFLPDDLVHEAVRNLDVRRRVDLEPTEEVVLGVLVDLGFDLDVAAEVLDGRVLVGWGVRPTHRVVVDPVGVVDDEGVLPAVVVVVAHRTSVHSWRAQQLIYFLPSRTPGGRPKSELRGVLATTRRSGHDPPGL